MSVLSGSSMAKCEDSGAWYIDGGATRHMIGTRAMFLELTEVDRRMLTKDGYANTHAVEGVGRVLFQLEFGGYLEISSVLFVPELRKNLLSVSTLEDDGYAVLHVEGRVIIYPVSEGVDAARMIGTREGNVYRLRGQLVGDESGGRSNSVATMIAMGREDSCNSMRRPSWYEMTLEDE